MAEAAAVIGLVSSIASLVALSAKIVSRVKEYGAQTDDVPKAFRALAERLPLLTQTLTRIKARAQTGHTDIDVVTELGLLVKSILEQVTLVERCLEGVLPVSTASRFDRVLLGLKSVARDDKVNQAIEKIHYGTDVLVLHQTTSAVEVGDHILTELGRLNLQNAQSSPFQPSTQQAFGLCFASAPLIDPDVFIGRRTEMQQLHQWLSPSPRTRVQRVVSIVGLGGLGKTQLSLAYAREYGNHYSSVFWLNAKDRTTLQQCLSALHAMLFPDKTVAATVNESERVDRVRHWLSESWNDQWLVIFDNYDDPSLPNIVSPTGFDLRQFFPMRAQGSILITTRSTKLPFCKPLRLHKMEDVDLCVAVLSQRSGQDMTKDPDSQRLVVRLDGLPLALAVAGTYLAQTGASCAEYLEFYDTAWQDLHGSDAEELMEYENRTLSSTWIMSLDQIRQQDPDAAELLQFWGYFSHEDIWYELIRAGAAGGPPWIGRVTASKIRFQRAMSRLGDYSLVEAIGGSYRVHPCLHDWVCEYLNQQPNASLFVTSVLCLERTVPDEENIEYWIKSRRLINHINRLRHPRFETLWDSQCLQPDVSTACNTFGGLYRLHDEYHSADVMYTRALAGMEKALKPNPKSILRVLNNLGLLYMIEGRRLEAEQMLKRALAGEEKEYGPEHALTLDVVANLAQLYVIQDKVLEAEQMFRRVLNGHEKTFGSEHPSTLRIVNNLAFVHSEQGRLAEAEQGYERALTGKDKVLGSEHHSTLVTVCALAGLYLKQGKLLEAERMYKRGLVGKEKTLGPNHSSTLDTVNDLAELYVERGRISEAEQMFQRAVAGQEKVFGPGHASTFTAVNNLGKCYLARGKLNKAEEQFRRVLDAYIDGRTDILSGVAVLRLMTTLRKAAYVQSQCPTASQTSLAKFVEHSERWVKDQPLIMLGLGQVLVHFRDGENATMAFVYSLEHFDGTVDFIECNCDGCRQKIHIDTGLWLCPQCEDYGLCNDCMSKYTRNDLSLPACDDHDYCDVVKMMAPMLHTSASGESREVKVLMTREAWLSQLREKYPLHSA